MALFRKKKTSDNKQEKQDNKSVDFENKKTALKSDTQKSKHTKGKGKGSYISYKILVHPLITEKTTVQNSLNQYAFIVSNTANKIDIKHAIKESYGVEPIKVATQNMSGKMVRSGRNSVMTRRKNWKKAIVTIPQDKKIDVYEGV